MEQIITFGLMGVAIYLGLGLVFSLFFLTMGIGKVDEVAKGSGIGFRLIILPGVVLLWIYLLTKWLNVKS